MDGKLYVAGGYNPADHSFLREVEVFDDVQQAWYGLPSLTEGRAGLGLAGLGGKVYAVGGWRGHQYLRCSATMVTILHCAPCQRCGGVRPPGEPVAAWPTATAEERQAGAAGHGQSSEVRARGGGQGQNPQVVCSGGGEWLPPE